MLPRLAIVVPCYNEQEVLPETIKVLGNLVSSLVSEGKIAENSYLLFVDDCSRDNTWQIITEAHSIDDNLVKGITFAHNSGQQNAILAGLFTVMDNCDCAITIDADLQDDTEAISKMIDCYKEGAEVVFGVRSSRDTDTWFKRNSARAFYRVQQWLGVDTIYDHSEYRLMSSRAIQLLSEYGERNMFLRSLILKIGLKTAIVTYPRYARLAGETKYPLSKLLSLSIDGITSFSAKPIRMIFFVGLFFLMLAIIVSIYALVSYFEHNAISGWTSLILSVWFLGSLILMAIGVVGEYIGKIFIEVKHRPRYAIKDSLLWQKQK